PFIGHTGSFALGGNKMAAAFLNKVKSDAVVRVKGIGFDFAIPSGPYLIRKALVSSNHLDWNITVSAMLGKLFGGSKRLCDAIKVDNSGISPNPYPGSQVHPGRRMGRNQHIFFNDAFSKKSMDEIVPRFVANLYLQCLSFSIGTRWVEMDDLFSFVYDLAFPCAVKSFYGESILKINPGLQANFLAFENYAPFLASGMPTWLKPNAMRVRSKCHTAMKKWRADAMRRSVEDPESESAAWDPAWGLGALRRRNKLREATDGLYDEDAHAASDLATIWAFTTNVIPASFWFLFEILNSKQLLERARTDIESSKTATGSIDPTKMVNAPLLQSIYAEVLRLHTASLLSRTSKQEHRLDGWIIPKSQAVMISTQVEHRSQYWNTVDSNTGTHHPPSAFFAERFLVKDESGNEKFSLDGKQGRWIPYGMGEHMCPGRNFAKFEMMLVFAVVMDKFEIELRSPEGWTPDDDLKRYGFGALMPKQKVGFRIRERV
ncbi:cytochrome P450, partial [Periconia macrospinosa]